MLYVGESEEQWQINKTKTETWIHKSKGTHLQESLQRKVRISMRLTEEDQQNENQWSVVVVVVVKDQDGSRDQGSGWRLLGGAAHPHRGGDRRRVRGDRTALTGGGPVGRRPSGRRSGSAASVAEARHHLSGSLREDELLAQFHVGPAFSCEENISINSLGEKRPEREFSCSLRCR